MVIEMRVNKQSKLIDYCSEAIVNLEKQNTPIL